MLPWSKMLRAALAAGIAPDAFWRLSMSEWRALTSRESGLNQVWLAALLNSFPDTEPF